MHLGQRNTAMCVAVDLFQSDVSVAGGTDQQRIAKAELTKRPDAVEMRGRLTIRRQCSATTKSVLPLSSVE